MKRAKITAVVSYIACAIAGIVFIFSAISKIISADQFELYLFSQRIFGFHLSTLAARFIIGMELTLGVLLLTGLKSKLTVRVSMFVLVAFSIFLLTKILVGSHENCNCFGEFAPLDPKESLVKNLILISLLLIGWKRKNLKIKRSTLITSIITSVMLISPFILTPPDLLYSMIYPIEERVDEPSAVIIQDSTFHYSIGNKIIFLSSPSCHYCKMAAKKLSIIADKTGRRNDVYFYFFGTEKAVTEFWANTGVEPFPYAILKTQEIIHLTKGSFPAIMFLKDGQLLRRSGYRDFTEADFR